MGDKKSKRERLDVIAGDWKKAKAAYDEAKKNLGAIREELDKEMGKKFVFFTDRFVILLPERKRSDIDAKRLRRERPDIAAEYERDIPYRELTINERKAKVKAA